MTTFRKIIEDASIWGELYEPLKPKKAHGNGLRVVLFTSCNCGNTVIKNLSLYEQRYPGSLNLVGVATDEPVDTRARISIKQRIWSQFTPEQRVKLKSKIIESSMEAGIPCYTGAVKTDYFRNLFKTWNPDVLIMFCFGQKLDSFLFNFPAMGAYNFHPSDLPKQIGAGTQPFQNAIRNGLKTSPMVIHQVTELIDMGPIIGVSTPINICLADGSYPKSLITLLEKTTSIGGWMSVQLIAEINKRLAKGENSPIEWIDFEKEFPDDIKRFLMSPATNEPDEMYEVPLHPLLLK